MRRALGALSVGLLAGGLVGCGEEDPTIDLPAVEEAVAAYARDAFPFATVGEATCPVEVEIGEGAVFQCVVVVNGQPLRVEVTQEDDRADRVTYVAVDAVLDMMRVVDDVRGKVIPQFTGGVNVDCGAEPVRVVVPGTTIECRGTDPLGVTRTIRVTVTNAAGDLEISVV